MSNNLPYPLALHAVRDDRDSGGRFVAGNPGRPPASEHSRLRVQTQRAIAADFLRHMEEFMQGFRKSHQREYLALALQALDEADDRPGEAEAHEPTAAAPDVLALVTEGRERLQRQQAGRDAVRAAYSPPTPSRPAR